MIHSILIFDYISSLFVIYLSLFYRQHYQSILNQWNFIGFSTQSINSISLAFSLQLFINKLLMECVQTILNDPGSDNIEYRLIFTNTDWFNNNQLRIVSSNMYKIGKFCALQLTYSFSLQNMIEDQWCMLFQGMKNKIKPSLLAMLFIPHLIYLFIPFVFLWKKIDVSLNYYKFTFKLFVFVCIIWTFFDLLVLS